MNARTAPLNKALKESAEQRQGIPVSEREIGLQPLTLLISAAVNRSVEKTDKSPSAGALVTTWEPQAANPHGQSRVSIRELLASAPLEAVDLERPRDLGRVTEL